MPSVKFEKNPVLLNLKAFLLIDTSIILNWLLRGTNLSTKNCYAKIALQKLILSQNKRPYNLETFEDNHKKFGT